MVALIFSGGGSMTLGVEVLDMHVRLHSNRTGWYD